MRLATLRTAGTTVAARIDGGEAITISGFTDVGELLRSGDLGLATAADGPRLDLASAELAPPILAPGKIICVGLNYRAHITEMGREIPEFPTLFTKYADALIGATDDVPLPPESTAVDWEGELAVVVGSTVRRATPEQARQAIAGYSVVNDVTMRDWQYRSAQWFQGKAWEACTPIGPVLVTPDELLPGAELITQVDDEVVQRVAIDDLVFDSAALVAYISTIFTLRPGDTILTGTPGGVGHARTPRRYLAPGQILRTSIDGIGELVNHVVAETVEVDL